MMQGWGRFLSRLNIVAGCREGTATLECSLTDFYDDKGFLHEDEFAAKVRKLLSNFEQNYKKFQ